MNEYPSLFSRFDQAEVEDALLLPNYFDAATARDARG